MRQYIIGALVVAVVIVLVRTIAGSPIIKRVASEGFQGSGSGAGTALFNTSTACPKGSTMYMYDGVAYCCNGRIDPDADTVQRSCRAAPLGTTGIFCTLGPGKDGVPNCLRQMVNRYKEYAKTACPTIMPNFCANEWGAATVAKCCAGPANETLSDCADSNPANQCTVVGPQLALKNPTSCDFLRLLENQPACPTNYTKTTMQGQGNLSGLTVIACTDNNQICYPSNILEQIQGLGYSTAGLTECS